MHYWFSIAIAVFIFHHGSCESELEILKCADALTDLGDPLPGQYRPQCDQVTGNYQRIQHHFSTGYKWCVHLITGKEIKGTRINGRDGAEPACPDLKCHEKVENYEGVLVIGAYIPQCDANGNYEQIQTHGSTGYSWCVHKITGKKHQGTDKAPGQGQPLCPALKCEEKVPFMSGGLRGAYIPQCDDNGNYKRVQSHASTGYSFCVHLISGEKHTGTDIPPGKKEIECPTLTCVEKASKARRGLIGAFVPQCDENGHYNRVQSHGSTGYSWCVHKITGVKHEGTDTPPGQGEPTCPELTCEEEAVVGADCEQTTRPNEKLVLRKTDKGYIWCVEGERGCPALSCTEHVAGLSSTPMIGRFTPQCDDNGDYQQIQSHGSSGFSWCVDTKTGKEVPNTRVRGRPTCPE